MSAGLIAKYLAMGQRALGVPVGETGGLPEVDATPLPATPTFRAPSPDDVRLPVAAPRVVYQFNPSESLTACLAQAEHRETARRIFQLLHEVALHTIRARGLPQRPDVAVFHLPVELIASHLEIDRTTVWRNLRPLLEAGVLDARDHYDSLKGMTAVTGKVWAVSVTPERILAGKAEPVKVRHADLVFPWRDLTADVECGRTAYAVTRTEERIAADKALRESRAPQVSQAHTLAQARATERATARTRGERVPTGRAAATRNAAATRSAQAETRKTCPARPPRSLQQSREGLKAVERGELIQWALAPFSTHTPDVSLTVARAFSGGLDAVFTLPTLAGLSKGDRNAAVESTARSLASAFEDTDNVRFWCWLLWQLVRGADQGQDWSDDVAHLLARVLHDIHHDESMHTRTQKKPAALVVNDLRASGLLDALRALAPTRAGRRPTRPMA